MYLLCQSFNATNICSRCSWKVALILYFGEAYDILAMHKRLDIETQGRTDGRDIFTVEFLEDSGLPSVIEAPVHRASKPVL